MGKQRSSHDGRKARAEVHTANMLEKIDMLRSFAGDGFSEQDLTDCLKQCGYNVETAATKLLTGEYTKRRTNHQAGSYNDGDVISLTTPEKKPLQKVASSGSDTKPAASSSSTNDPIRPKAPKSSKRSKARKSDESEDPRSAAPNSVTMPRRKSTPTVTPPALVDYSYLSAAGLGFGLGFEWLLCHYTISDASCSRKYARVDYMESLEISASFSTKGQPMLHFRGKNIEGRLSEHLAAMLTPLMRPQTAAAFAASGKKKVTPTKHSKHAQTQLDVPFVRLECHSVMEASGLNVFEHIPVSLSVWLLQPRQFFELFDDGNGASVESNNMYFENRKLAASKSVNSSLSPLARAAFDLLQWAQYGDLPRFKPLSDTKQASIETAAGDEVSVEKKGDDLDEDEAMLEMNEDDFEAASMDNSSQQAKEWTKSVSVGADDWTCKLPEADDPSGFAPGIHLRPYQKQALYWMRRREVDGETREQVEEQLRLLSELAEQQQQNPSSTVRDDALSSREYMKCDCGPVILSEKARLQTKTIDGQVNPVSHPLWKRRYLASRDKKRSLCFYVNELLGVATHETPKPPIPCSGGILGDAMGLGKTVMLMALILQAKAENTRTTTEGGPKTTLVVAKLSLLPQWQVELRTKTNLTYLLYYEEKKRNISVEDMMNVDVVITTYGTMQGELKRKTLLQMEWLRVVLDEAHCIRNQQTLASKACAALKANHRWCVSGTIIQNSLDDVFGIMKFLHHEPWCLPVFWKQAVSKPLSQTGDDLDNEARADAFHMALDRVKRAIAPLMLRRTKDSLTKEGKPILTLPPVEAKTVYVDFTVSEREFYNALLARSSALFDGYVDRGVAKTSYFKILSLISRLRQACDHISLTVNNRRENGETAKEVDENSAKSELPDAEEDGLDQEFLNELCAKMLSSGASQANKRKWDKEEDGGKKRPRKYMFSVANALSDAVANNASNIKEECPICLDEPLIGDAVITPCGHVFCRECLVGYLRGEGNAEKANTKQEKLSGFQCFNGPCPTCKTEVDSSKIIAVTKASDGGYTTTYLAACKSVATAIEREPAPKREMRDTGEGNAAAAARLILEESLKGCGSSKLDAVMNELYAVWELDPGSKVVVFSQFLRFLDLLEEQFKKQSIPHHRLEGKDSLRRRGEILEEFGASRYSTGARGDSAAVAYSSRRSTHKRGEVLLISMGTGAEGLNLVAASSVFIVDPWWNAAKEDQCVNRIHRIGQLADQIRVRKFIVKDSVEERMVELQDRKKNVADQVYNDAGYSGEGGSARLNMDDFRLIFQK